MTTYEIKSEADKIPMAIKYIDDQLKELNYHIKQCDFYEDPSENLIYAENCYSEEKRSLKIVKEKLETIKDILAVDSPRFIIR